MLPCCPFSFTAKFQRRQAQLSVFRDYLNFIREVGQLAGFRVAEDRMRIPSTKRVCFVGRPATTSEDGEGYVERTQRLLAYLHASQPDVIATTATTLSKEFKPRERLERVRNCTQLDRALVRGIVSQVVDMCLAAADERRQVVVAASGNSTWNAGGSLALDVVAARLAQSGWDLSRLKAECGGLQTLLRNHHAVFTVRGGAVRLRVPGEDAATAAAGRRTAPKQRANAAAVSRLKTKACWHFVHHPDGCPLTSETCSWLHVTDVET